MKFQHIIPEMASTCPPYAWWAGAFNEDELNILQRMCAEQQGHAMVGECDPSQGPDVLHKVQQIRRSKVGWLEYSPEYSWVYEKLSMVISNINAQFFNYDITGFGEAIQLTNYESTDHGTYGWHTDRGHGGGTSRKLSLVMHLSHPNEYEGGNLQLLESSDPINVEQERGTIQIFPSWMLHRVTPVTRGTRQTIVAWITGPNFR